MNNFDNLKNFLGQDEKAAEDFLTILKLPDEQFDEFYPVLMPRIDEVFSNTRVQREVLTNLETMPVDLNEANEGLDKMFSEIETWEISENKKNFIRTFLNKSKELTIDLYNNPREKIEVKVHKISEDAILPKYAHPTDAGADVYSISDVTINSNETKLISTGLTVDMPAGYAIFIVPRSGMSYKTKLRIANSIGVIDHLYHQEIKIIIENIGQEAYLIKKGERIAQMMIFPVPMIQWAETQEALDDTGRSGFGSTGR